MSDKVASAPVGVASGGVSDSVWVKALPKHVDAEDTMSPAMVKKSWNDIYREAGMRGSSEDEQRAVRLAVYVYFALNGTSRVGNYTGRIVTSSGVAFDSAVLVRVLSKFSLRRFMRGNMDESYEALKMSGAMSQYPRFIAKVGELGISPEVAFATADWMSDCRFFTPEESRANRLAFNYAIKRATGSRQGRSLEDVERSDVQSGLRAQEPESQHSVVPGTAVW